MRGRIELYHSIAASNGLPGGGRRTMKTSGIIANDIAATRYEMSA